MAKQANLCLLLIFLRVVFGDNNFQSTDVDGRANSVWGSDRNGLGSDVSRSERHGNSKPSLENSLDHTLTQKTSVQPLLSQNHGRESASSTGSRTEYRPLSTVREETKPGQHYPSSNSEWHGTATSGLTSGQQFHSSNSEWHGKGSGRYENSLLSSAIKPWYQHPSSSPSGWHGRGDSSSVQPFLPQNHGRESASSTGSRTEYRPLSTVREETKPGQHYPSSDSGLHGRSQNGTVTSGLTSGQQFPSSTSEWHERRSGRFENPSSSSATKPWYQHPSSSQSGWHARRDSSSSKLRPGQRYPSTSSGWHGRGSGNEHHPSSFESKSGQHYASSSSGWQERGDSSSSSSRPGRRYPSSSSRWHGRGSGGSRFSKSSSRSRQRQRYPPSSGSHGRGSGGSRYPTPSYGSRPRQRYPPSSGSHGRGSGRNKYPISSSGSRISQHYPSSSQGWQGRGSGKSRPRQRYPSPSSSRWHGRESGRNRYPSSSRGSTSGQRYPSPSSSGWYEQRPKYPTSLNSGIRYGPNGFPISV